jgi:uncharacterized protein YllA (UPF0747 family)
MSHKQAEQWSAMQFEEQDLFKPILDLEVAFVKKHTTQALDLQEQINHITTLYLTIKNEVVKVDPTLGAHTDNLAQQAKAKLLALEKKMLRAEKRKQSVDIKRIHRIKKELFPQDNLQEREEHFSKWVGQYDLSWIETIMEHSAGLESKFSIIKFD